jgi:hypothetical protein
VVAAMAAYESEQDVVSELVREFPAVPGRIIERILHAYLETTHDLGHAAKATRIRIDDALHDD